MDKRIAKFKYTFEALSNTHYWGTYFKGVLSKFDKQPC